MRLELGQRLVLELGLGVGVTFGNAYCPCNGYDDYFQSCPCSNYYVNLYVSDLHYSLQLMSWLAISCLMVMWKSWTPGIF